jgi:hypothetical protein
VIVEDTKTIILKAPVELGSESYDRLELKEPTAAQMVKAQKETARNGNLAGDILLIAEISGVPKPAVDKIGISAIVEAQQYLAGFMNPPTLGSTS